MHRGRRRVAGGHGRELKHVGVNIKHVRAASGLLEMAVAAEIVWCNENLATWNTGAKLDSTSCRCMVDEE